MLIYKDLISDDEIFSDLFRVYESPVVGGKPCKALYSVKAKFIDVGGAFDDRLIGANKSAEEPDEDEACDQQAKVIDIVHNHRLVETAFGKKDYMTYIKGYMKTLNDKLEEEGKDVVEFKKNAQDAVKAIISEFKEWQFFQGENMNPDGMIILCKWEEDVPFFYFFADGLKEEKV